MKNKLQYVYSISVFIGVLFTSYLMMNQDGNARTPLRSVQGPGLRTEALALDPAVNQLFEMENAISKLRKEKQETLKRVPSDMNPRNFAVDQ